MNEQELGNRIYESAKMSTAAFYTHNQKDYDYWSEIFYDLTIGMSKKKMYALSDKADLDFRCKVDETYNEIISKYQNRKERG